LHKIGDVFDILGSFFFVSGAAMMAAVIRAGSLVDISRLLFKTVE
jgi:hypothetical protein